MTDNVENLVLEHLKRIQATLDEMRGEMRELRTRQNETHAAVIALRRDQANDAEISAHLQVQLDSVKDRLSSIERRLELHN
jgi:prefoldin subunit 5